jgi:hypothetical protein
MRVLQKRLLVRKTRRQLADQTRVVWLAFLRVERFRGLLSGFCAVWQTNGGRSAIQRSGEAGRPCGSTDLPRGF